MTFAAATSRLVDDVDESDVELLPAGEAGVGIAPADGEMEDLAQISKKLGKLDTIETNTQKNCGRKQPEFQGKRVPGNGFRGTDSGEHGFGGARIPGNGFWGTDSRGRGEHGFR